MKIQSLLISTLALLTLSVAASSKVQATYRIIPIPQNVQLNASAKPFLLTAKSSIVAGKEAQNAAKFLAQYIESSTSRPIAIASKGEIELLIDAAASSNAEGYKLEISDKSIKLSAPTAAGLFYGVQTLRKSIPASATGADIEFAAATITDFPRFAYRGTMLDVARHFSTVDQVKRFIDILVLHNINTFHFHITDDQGWRLAMDKYPLLEKISSTRPGTLVGRYKHGAGDGDGTYDNVPVSGFYTPAQISDIVAYAADRYITVIPEIDLPGHMRAAMAAYPELGCTGGPYTVAKRWGVFEEVLCVGNETSMKFLEDVMDQVTSLFPSKYIHIGGDECPKVAWQKCPKCQALIEKLGIKSDKKHTAEQYLQSYAMGRIEKYLAAKGRRIIGWDEILEGNVSKDATVMSWRGTNGGIEAARLGRQVIMAPYTHLYFDYAQGTGPDEPLTIPGFIPIRKAYEFEPVPDGLTAEQQALILGAQANLWTEYLPTQERREYQILPRLAALSEMVWSAKQARNYDDFATRMPTLAALYDAAGYSYARNMFKEQ